MSRNITRAEVLVQRNGAAWYMPQRVDPDTPSVDRLLLGLVRRDGKGWRFSCADCKPFLGAVRRTRREAILDLIEHWNEER